MSDINPNDVQNGIEATGYLAAAGGAIMAMLTWIFRRQIKRLDVIEERYVPNDRHEKSIEKLEAGMHDIRDTFLGKHEITHKKIDDNQRELMAILLDMKGKSDK